LYEQVRFSYTFIFATGCLFTSCKTVKSILLTMKCNNSGEPCG